MKWPRALFISLSITAALTIMFSLFFGGRAFALFLFLPFGFLLNSRSRPKKPPSPDSKPIEPN